MKVKVLIPFNDKVTGQHHEKGAVINLTAKRFNEISRKGRYIELLEEPETKKEKE